MHDYMATWIITRCMRSRRACMYKLIMLLRTLSECTHLYTCMLWSQGKLIVVMLTHNLILLSPINRIHVQVVPLFCLALQEARNFAWRVIIYHDQVAPCTKDKHLTKIHSICYISFTGYTPCCCMWSPTNYIHCLLGTDHTWDTTQLL